MTYPTWNRRQVLAAVSGLPAWMLVPTATAHAACVGWWEGNAFIGQSSTHGRQLLAVRYDAVRLRAPRDADERAKVARRQRGVCRDCMLQLNGIIPGTL